MFTAFVIVVAVMFLRILLSKETRFELESCVKLVTIENSYLDTERTVGELTRRSKAR